jgi:hypothetical protein
MSCTAESELAQEKSGSFDCALAQPANEAVWKTEASAPLRMTIPKSEIVGKIQTPSRSWREGVWHGGAICAESVVIS